MAKTKLDNNNDVKEVLAKLTNEDFLVSKVDKKSDVVMLPYLTQHHLFNKMLLIKSISERVKP